MDEIEHLFRREAGRIVAVLTRLLGVHNLALAEDVMQDAFCRALEVWKFRGLPDNPSAWLMAAAKNRAIDVLRRERTARTFAPELTHRLRSEATLHAVVNECFEPNAIRDDQLRMMFTCCHPRLPEEAQVMLVLHVLCGFSIAEVAAAFLTSYTAVEKRLPRAKKVLASSPGLFDVASPKAFAARLPAVQRALYLLFNEGYHGLGDTRQCGRALSANGRSFPGREFRRQPDRREGDASPMWPDHSSTVRRELCSEAFRQLTLLLDRPEGATPSACALGALMCLLLARLPARLDGSGRLHSLAHQDRSLWDRRRLAQGMELLQRSATGVELTEYHLEAAIAFLHATAPSFASTDWQQIVELYDALLALRPSVIVALNRAIAVGHREGPEAGLAALDAIRDAERLATYPFYPAARAEFELAAGRLESACIHFAAAAQLSRNPTEREYFQRRLAAVPSVPGP